MKSRSQQSEPAESEPAEGDERRGRSPRVHITVGRFAIRPPVAVGIAVVLAALVVAGYLIGGTARGNEASPGFVKVEQVAGSNQSNSRYPGATVSSAEPRPDMTFTDTADQPYNIAARTKGKVLLLYFGYTNCPNLCPINMALAAKTIESLPRADRSDVVVVFVTIDPRRDTLPVIRSWLDKFDPAFVGLRGTTTEVHAAEADVGQPLSYVEGSATGDYQFEHAGYVLAYSPNAGSHLQFGISETVGQYATSLEHLVAYGYRT